MSNLYIFVQFCRCNPYRRMGWKDSQIVGHLYQCWMQPVQTYGLEEKALDRIPDYKLMQPVQTYGLEVDVESGFGHKAGGCNPYRRMGWKRAACICNGVIDRCKPCRRMGWKGYMYHSCIFVFRCNLYRCVGWKFRMIFHLSCRNTTYMGVRIKNCS